MSREDKKPLILYAEDDQDDFDALEDALDQITQNVALDHARNGEEAIAYLQNPKAERPSLIVLDLNMPIKNGKDVLVWLKTESEHKDIPVMVFTTSSREEDIRLCQSHNCTFFRKPTLYRDLLHIAQTMLQLSGEKAK